MKKLLKSLFAIVLCLGLLVGCGNKDVDLDLEKINEKLVGLKGDVIRVSADVTEEMLSSLEADTAITFTAYAVQYEGISTPEKAWEIIKSKEA